MGSREGIVKSVGFGQGLGENVGSWDEKIWLYKSYPVEMVEYPSGARMAKDKICSKQLKENG